MNDLGGFVSYAQNYEDVVLWRALGHIPNGLYVDVGAADPVVDSVTAALYQRGWSGLNIEPVPALAQALAAARPRDITVACGAGSVEAVALLTVVPDTGRSTFDPGVLADLDNPATELVEVPVRRLSDVLEEIGWAGRDLHILKVDVEGHDADVLEGADLDRWRPWVLVVEATAPGSSRPTHDSWEPLVLAAGYEFCLFDGLNRFYVHRSRSELHPALGYPACTFDEPFENRHQRASREALEHAHAEFERWDREIKRLAEALAHAHGELERSDGEIKRLAEALAEQELDAEKLAEARRQFVRWRHEAFRARAQESAAFRVADDERTARIAAEQELMSWTQQATNLEVELEATRATLSWRVTRPLRQLRGVRTDETPIDVPSIDVRDGDEAGSVADHVAPQHVKQGDDAVAAFHTRAAQVADLLGATPSVDTSPLEALARALDRSGESDLTKAWLCLVAAVGAYPSEELVRTEARVFRRLGGSRFAERLGAMMVQAVRDGGIVKAPLSIVTDGVVIDVTHTAQHDLQTGIQRVVRETCARWIPAKGAVPVWFDYGSSHLRKFDEAETERLVDWQDHMPRTHGTALSVRSLDHTPEGVVVPWRCVMLLPELTAEPARTGAYRALACTGVLRGIAMIGYDLIPITAAETVTEGMSQVFSLYLSMVKHATRLSAISEAAADDFRAFNGALGSQGMDGPVVFAHTLPTTPADSTDADIAALRQDLAMGDLPMVLVVGSHEPRKNHLVVLEAAERLWSEDNFFDLVFIGGSGWRSEQFDLEVERLQAEGRPVTVCRRVTETHLWAAYRVARFSVFPSLLEGYGLPIAESIACGTPVITSDYGSMAEVARGGGAMTVNPLDADALTEAMRSLLLDDELLERLRSEAKGRVFPTWDGYAESVWSFLVDGAT